MFVGYQAYVVSSSGSDVWFRTILPIIRKQKASSNIFIKKEKKKKKKKLRGNVAYTVGGSGAVGLARGLFWDSTARVMHWKGILCIII